MTKDQHHPSEVREIAANISLGVATLLYAIVNIVCVGRWTYPHEGPEVFLFFTLAPVAAIPGAVALKLHGAPFHWVCVGAFAAAMGIAFWLNGLILLECFASV